MKHKTVNLTWTLYQFKVPSSYKDELKVEEAEMAEKMIWFEQWMTTKLFIPKDKWRQHENCIILWDHQQWKHSRQC